MQIHELNNFNGSLGLSSYLAIDDGSDTGKISTGDLLGPTNKAMNDLSESLNARIDNIIAGGDAPSAAEVTDARRGENGVNYASLGDAIRGQVKLLNEAIEGATGFALVQDVTWIEGSYIRDSDGTIGASGNYKRTDFIEITEGIPIIVTSTNAENWDTYYNAWYDENQTFIDNFSYARDTSIVIYPPTGAKYIRMSCRKTVTITIDISGMSLLDITGIDDLLIREQIISRIKLHTGHRGNGTFEYATYRNSSVDPIYTEVPIRIYCDNAHKIGVIYFDGFEIGTAHYINTVGWATDITIPANSYFCVTVGNADDSATNEATTESIQAQSVRPLNKQIKSLADDLYDVKKQIVESGDNYLIDSALAKRYISISPSLGTLSKVNAFCIYNQNIYSIDGNYISLQDSAFNEISTTALDTGHGNSLQLGNNGKAYASGWDDQKVYIVDLDTLTIDGSITLPTTGYTTCAVDDLNQIAYIFQRDSYPDTEAPYTFIAYDYGNDQILYSKAIKPFAAMQSCDFYNGSIVVVSGLGNVQAPNYYRIYNTSGDLVAEYFISLFTNQEPEGVFFNRETHNLMISYLNGNVYEVSTFENIQE